MEKMNRSDITKFIENNLDKGVDQNEKNYG